MLFDVDVAIRIAAGAPIGTRLPFTWQSYSHSFIDPRRDLHF
jgi:hypothetical protein